MPTTPAPRTDLRLIFTMINGDTIRSDWVAAPDDFERDMLPEIVGDLLSADYTRDITIGGIDAAINMAHVMMVKIEAEEIR